MSSVLKVSTIDTPDGTGNIVVNRPLSGSGASLTSLPASPRKNLIINGNFDVWQRGTSFAGVTATGYQADRWEVIPATGCTMTISRQAFTAGQTDVPNEPSYFLRADITTAGSANAEISQKIEDVRTFAGQTIMVSFYAKSTAGTQGLNCRMHQDFGSGGSTRVTTGVSVKTLSSSWQKFTFSVALGSISGKTIGTSSYLAFNFYWANNSTSNDVDLAQVKVEKGSSATDFEPKSYAEELVSCQRYFTRKTEGTTSQRLCMGENVSATRNDPIFTFNPSLRAAPSLSVNTVGDFLIYSANTTYAATAINPDLMGTQSCNLMVTTGGTMTAGAAGQFVVNSTGATLDFSAEL